MYTVGLNAPKDGAGGNSQESLCLRWESERNPPVWPQCPGLNRGVPGTNVARPFQTMGSLGQVWERGRVSCWSGAGPRWSQPARRPRRGSYLAGSRPLGECIQRGRACSRGDLEQPQHRQEQQEWRPSHHGVCTGETAGAVPRGGEGAAFNRARWPCPQAGPASLAHTLRFWIKSLGGGTSLFGSPFPNRLRPQSHQVLGQQSRGRRAAQR